MFWSMKSVKELKENRINSIHPQPSFKRGLLKALKAIDVEKKNPSILIIGTKCVYANRNPLLRGDLGVCQELQAKGFIA